MYSGGDLAPAIAVELIPDVPVVPPQQLSPSPVAKPYGHLCRRDDVREEEGDKHTIARIELREPGPDPRPIDCDDRMVTHHPPIMSRWDVEDLVRAEVHRGAVVRLNSKQPLNESPGVVGRAAFLGSVVAHQSAATEGTMGAGLEHIPGDRGVAELHDVGMHSFELDPLVGGVEVLF
jgi:hypothetical protein